MSDPQFATSVPGSGVSTEATNMLQNFWPKVSADISNIKNVSQFVITGFKLYIIKRTKEY